MTKPDFDSDPSVTPAGGTRYYSYEIWRVGGYDLETAKCQPHS